MALAYEVKYDDVDLATYGFKLAPEGVTGREQLPPLRQNLEWIPGLDEPFDFGADFGERHITITGHVIGSTHSTMLSYIASIMAILEDDIETYAYKYLQFGDDPGWVYEAIYDGTFVTRPIGSNLTTKIALITISFLVKKDKIST